MYIITEMFRPEFEKLCANFERQVTGFLMAGLGVVDFVELRRQNIRYCLFIVNNSVVKTKVCSLLRSSCVVYTVV